MAVIRNGTTQTRRAAELTERLVGELHHANPDRQPIVLEDRISQTQRYNVRVIWDDWAALPLTARSRIILDAYEAAFPAKTGRISIAMGLTGAEATSIGLLPYAVVPSLKQSEAALRPRLAELINARGGVKGVGGLSLRFPTREQAVEALEQLNKALPDVWMVEHEVPRDD